MNVLKYKGQEVLNQDEQQQLRAEQEYNRYYANGLNSIAASLMELVNTIKRETATNGEGN